MINKNLPEKEAKNKECLSIGMIVDIVLKQDQSTMTLTRGKIKDFLTPRSYHPRGIKVRLDKDGIQRLYNTSSKSGIKDINYNKTEYIDEHFVGRVQRIYYPNNFGILIIDKESTNITEVILNQFKHRYKNNGCLIFSKNNTIDNNIKSYLISIEDKSIDIILIQQSINLINSNIIKDIINFLRLNNKEPNAYFLKNGKLMKLDI